MPTHDELLRDLRLKASKYKEIGGGLRVGRVLGDRVLVKTVVPRTELDDYEKRGLVIPETAKATYGSLPTTGIVLAVGEEVRERKLTTPHTPEGFTLIPILEVGDMVLFSRVAGMDFTVAEQQLRLINTKEILAVLVDTDDSVVEVGG